jgi:hemoglobin-like flavoprotein
MNAKLITDSFKKIIENDEKFYIYFYDHLFKIAPEVEYLFKNVDRKTQGKKLYQSLVMLVENIENEKAIVELLKPLGDRHKSYGTQLQHYPVVGQCLIDSLKYVIAEDWNDDIEKAWTETYESVVMNMI